MKKDKIILYGVFLGISVASMCISKTGQHIASGLLLLLGAIILYLYFYYKTKNLVNYQGLLALSFMGGEGIAAFQLSNLQTDWSLMTWICFIAFSLCFFLGYDGKEYFDMRKRQAVVSNMKEEKGGSYYIENEKINKNSIMEKRLFVSAVVVAVISFFSFVLEACILGYVPLFSKDTHAYNYFHITGVHYFTVTCMMTHALTLIYWMVHRENRKKGWCQKIYKNRIVILVIANMLALSIAILCISKFQLLLTVALPLFIYLMMKKDINIKRFLLIGAVIAVIVIAVMIVMIMKRNYAPGYLNDIFEMKNSNLPMFVQYPYIYIANNYANFNCLVEQVTDHTMGIRMAFPLFALTGLKFVSPFREWLIQPVYLTKTELNTLTIIYDAYYDFGLIGVILFGLLLGWICSFLNKKMKHDKNPVIYLFGGQIAMYVVLSFFSTWFSVPTTWFWLAVTGIIYWYVGWEHSVKNGKETRKY